jgi:choline kinase/uncharacterized membrane protein YbhN (UPF0104 family)
VARRDAIATGIEEHTPVGGHRRSAPGRGPTVGVVLAAGRSERLSGRTHGRSKALLRVGGIPLVELAIRTLRRSGIRRILVVVGHDAGRVALAALPAGGVEVVYAPDWQQGNGASLRAVEGYLADEERFALVCADHVFSPGALDALLGSPEPSVLFDPSPDPSAWDEGTRIRVVDGTVAGLSKELDEPAIDCGAFVLPRGVFDALRRAADHGDASLAGAVELLAATGPVAAVPIDGRSRWQDVDTPDDFRRARGLIRRSLVKDSDGPVSRYLNRPVSTRITVALARFRPRPTALSAVTFLLGMWGAWSLGAARPLAGALAVQAASILDGSDGETARLLDRSSARGALLDGIFDRMVDAAIVAGLWLWTFDHPTATFRLVVIAVSAVGWAVVATAARGPISIFDVPRSEQPVVTAILGGRDARLLIIAAGALTARPIVAFWAGMLTYGVGAAWRVVSVVVRRVGARPTARTRRTWSTAWRVVRALTFPAIAGAVFFGVLPRFADLDAAWDAMKSLSGRSVVFLALLAVWNLATYWPMLVAAMPGLSLAQAAVVGESATAVAMTVPAGGTVALAVSSTMYASWGFPATAIARSALATFVANMSFKLILPACSLVLLALLGEPTRGLLLTAILAVVIVVGSAALFGLLLRDEQIARRIGRAAERLASFGRSLAGRAPVTSWSEQAARFRSDMVDLLRERWQLLFAAELISQISVFAVLLASLRLVGVSSGDVNWAQAFAVFAFVRLGSAVPIVPGNVGLAELGYIGGLTIAGGDRAEVVAAVLLFRLLTYFVQIPIGGATYLVWRRRRARVATG